MRNIFRKDYLPVFDRGNYFIHMPTFYLIKTGTVASIISYGKINHRQLFHELVKEYQVKPEHTVVLENYYPNQSERKLHSAYLELSDNLMVYLNSSKVETEVFHNTKVSSEELSRLEAIILKFRRADVEEKTVGIITLSSTGQLDIKRFPIHQEEIDVNKYYNTDFLEFDELVKERLSVRNGKGILLFHGEPGTGKTTYLRHLIQSLHRSFLYLPSELSSQLSQPGFVTFLLAQARHSIIIIEDCEQLLMKRKPDTNSPISGILNMSDGLMSDVLSIQLICTFNSVLSQIDPAILRKGRLISRYHFKALAPDKANTLLKEKGIENTTSEPLTLAEIFNYNDRDQSKNRLMNQVGFAMNGKEN